MKDENAPWWFGAIFIATGAVITGIGVGWIDVDPSSVHAPYWVLTACGGLFALGGVMTYTSRLDERVNQFLALILIGMFASIASRIAFGPGEREFSGGASAARSRWAAPAARPSVASCSGSGPSCCG